MMSLQPRTETPIMALVISDLDEDMELDASALRAITGGSHLTGRRYGSVSAKYIERSRYETSSIVPGLIKTFDLRKL